MRKCWTVLLLTVAATALAAPSPARIPAGRLGVGDSIMLSASDELADRDIDVRARVGRRFDEGVARVRSLEANDALPSRVLVHLGTNGPIDPADCEALVEVVGPARHLFLVTVRVPRDWMRPNNAILRSCAAAHEPVHLVRWAMLSGPHPEWFADDGYHLNAVGQRRYASYLDRQMRALAA